MPQRTLFLVDGHSQLYRAFYAIRNLNAPDGTPTNAVYGFTAMLLKILREKKPERIAIAFDTGKPTFRHEEYKAYKAERPPMPEDLIRQIPVIKEILDALGIPRLEKPGLEADDVIATLALKAAAQGFDVAIVSGDKDLQQLLSDKIMIYDGVKNRIITPESLKADLGIAPDQVRDLLALAGDTSDNVPGVPGIGMKTALELVKQWGTLENLLAHLDELKGHKRLEKIREHKDLAILSKKLVTLVADAPVDVEDVLRAGREPDREKLSRLFSSLGFKKFMEEFTLAAPTTPAASTTTVTKVEPVSLDGKHEIISDSKSLAAFAKKLSGAKSFSLEIVASSDHPSQAALIGVAISLKRGEAVYLPLHAPLGETALGEKALASLASIFENPAIRKIGGDLKFATVALAQRKIRLQGLAFDTAVAGYLLDATRREYDLSPLAREHLGAEVQNLEEFGGKGAKAVSPDVIPVADVARYACRRAEAALALEPVLKEKLKGAGHLALFDDIEMPLVGVLADMESAGIPVDTNVLRVLAHDTRKKLEGMEADIYKHAGKEFNIGSPKQLAEILFTGLGLTAVRKTKTGFSTDSDTLEELAAAHPLPALILEYRQLSKLLSTYLDALPLLIEPDGRIRTIFEQTTTATGRLSSRDPNLQNIPIRTDTGSAIRRAFTAPDKNHVLLTADYSQIELRVLAHFSEDEALLAAYRDDRDIHAAVAAEINGVAEKDVTPDMRRQAKAVNFGIVYGLSAFGLAKGIRIPQGEAKHFIEAYFAKYTGVRKFIDDTIAKTQRTGFAETLFGRRRLIPGIQSRNPQEKSFAERTAVNTVIQGTAADLIKKAMIAVHRRLEKEKRQSRLLLQIHDELVLETPKSELDTVTKIIREEMASVAKLRVPLTVSTAEGSNWLEAK